MSSRLETALVYSAQLHSTQRRKATDVPYVTHLWAVAAIVGEHGGDEDQIIAALLHDGPEDCGGLAILDEIRREFGDRVAETVAGCSDTFESPKPPWRQRKEAYISHLSTTTLDTLLVSAADKLHNSRSILAELRRDGLSIFDRFNGKQEGTLWYYRALVQAYQTRLELAASKVPEGFSQLVDELDRVVSALEAESTARAQVDQTSRIR